MHEWLECWLDEQSLSWLTGDGSQPDTLHHPEAKPGDINAVESDGGSRGVASPVHWGDPSLPWASRRSNKRQHSRAELCDAAEDSSSFFCW